MRVLVNLTAYNSDNQVIVSDTSPEAMDIASIPTWVLTFRIQFPDAIRVVVDIVMPNKIYTHQWYSI